MKLLPRTEAGDRCTVCERDPARVNGWASECSHVNCPSRRHAWSERPTGRERQVVASTPKDYSDALPLDVALRQGIAD